VDSEHYFGRDLKASWRGFFRIPRAGRFAGSRQGGAGVEAEDAGGEDPGDPTASLLGGQDASRVRGYSLHG
jgi:hypothetical protein